MACPASQMDLDGDLEKARREDRERLQPWTTGNEGIVVGQYGARVERVIHIERD